MPTNNDYIDLQFEEVSPQRAIDNASFTHGLCDWRFSISPSLWWGVDSLNVLFLD